MSGKTAISDIGVVGIPVADQDRALDFYVNTLGFEVRLDAPTPTGGRWLMVAAPGAGTSVALVAASDEYPAGVDTGIRFFSEDAEADHAYLGDNGVKTDELLRWPGVPPMFSFRDVDGNKLEIVGATAR